MEGNTFSGLYVDDILLTNNDISFLCKTKNFLSKNFEMKDLGDASFVLGTHRDDSQIITRELYQKCVENV